MRGRSFPGQSGGIGSWLLILLLLAILILLLWPQVFIHVHYPHDVKQKAQFHSMEAALELFRNERGDYPPSGATDVAGQPYCGAMKLNEALMGRDLLGFHPKSRFRADGLEFTNGAALYPDKPDANSLKARIGPYLQAENAQAYRLVDVYGKGNTGPFREDGYVLCDTYTRKHATGAETGMPILYFRAHPNGTMHDASDPDNPANIYDYRDNLALLKLGVPGDPNALHPLADPRRFYLNTQNDKYATHSRPYRPDSFILISAGPDGLYGTGDDICNFEWTYRE
jgi:hypothetical protein